MRLGVFRPLCWDTVLHCHWRWFRFLHLQVLAVSTFYVHIFSDVLSSVSWKFEVSLPWWPCSRTSFCFLLVLRVLISGPIGFMCLAPKIILSTTVLHDILEGRMLGEKTGKRRWWLGNVVKTLDLQSWGHRFNFRSGRCHVVSTRMHGQINHLTM